MPHDFKVKEIELPISGSSTSDALDSSIRNEVRRDDTSKDTYFIPVAKILNNIEKSYDKGKKILAESKNISDTDIRKSSSDDGETLTEIEKGRLMDELTPSNASASSGLSSAASQGDTDASHPANESGKQ